MKKAVLFFGLVISLTVVGFGQRTITNSTLVKFQQKRLAAERDYRDNYVRMGFPSPEELDRQRDTDMTARLQLADRLRQARLANERLELERRGLDLEAIRIDNEAYQRESSDSYGGVFYGGGFYSGFGGNGFHRDRRRHGYGGHLGIFSTPRNRLLPFIDRRGAYRATPFGVTPVHNSRPGRVIFRGGGRRR